ncbi:MAG TPA: hypothetical protein VGF74_20510 [Thermoleophilaceae bacterium]
MLHDPTTRRLFAEARNQELRRYAKPRALHEADAETAQPRTGRRLRRLFTG